MSKTWLVSDTHFHHANLCVGTSLWTDPKGCRQFNTVEEHDGTILENINSLVMPEDILIHHGDFTVGSKGGPLKLDKKDAYVYFRNKIKCKNIYYIRGNHSLAQHDLENLGIFNAVMDYFEYKYKKLLVCMFHYPIHSWREMSNHSYHTFGHEHGHRVRGRSMDIGLDSNNFKPWLLDDVIERLRHNEILKEGHHQ